MPHHIEWKAHQTYNILVYISLTGQTRVGGYIQNIEKEKQTKNITLSKIIFQNLSRNKVFPRQAENEGMHDY